MEAVFEVQTAHGLVNLFNSPDALSVAEIWARERQLGQACEYDKQNLHYSCIYLENSIDDNDDGPVLWHIIQWTLRGAATPKMIQVQKIINETKLTDVPDLDVRTFHEIVKPALFACSEQGKLPLDVGPTVIKNHLGPQDVAFNATLLMYIGKQAVIGTAEEQYVELLPHMDNLVNIYNRCCGSNGF